MRITDYSNLPDLIWFLSLNLQYFSNLFALNLADFQIKKQALAIASL
jgi:hypothetical protein